MWNLLGSVETFLLEGLVWPSCQVADICVFGQECRKIQRLNIFSERRCHCHCDISRCRVERQSQRLGKSAAAVQQTFCLTSHVGFLEMADQFG